jgi:hypothetical protein
MSNADRQEYLQGQVQALLACVFAMIQSHQDVARLATCLDQSLEACLAKLGGDAHPEEMIDGIQDIKSKVAAYVQNVGKRTQQER